MPNLAKIYTDSTGGAKLPLEDDVKKQEELQARQIEKTALHLDWLQNPETVGFFKKLSEEAAILNENTITISLDASVDRTKQIATNLIRLGEIRRIIKTYGK